jgi:hypothetical protein
MCDCRVRRFFPRSTWDAPPNQGEVGADHLSQSDPIVSHVVKTMENKPPMAGNGFYKPPIKMVITYINHIRN